MVMLEAEKGNHPGRWQLSLARVLQEELRPSETFHMRMRGYFAIHNGRPYWQERLEPTNNSDN